MKSNKVTIIMLILFFIGLFLLLYPSISNYYNQKIGSRAIVDYESIIKNIDEDKYKDMIDAAYKYNEQISKLKNPLITYESVKGYNELLDLNDNGMIGYIKIKKIKVELPIYHGTSKNVLNTAVGHLEGSSLPVGGMGTHSVLSAHRGLPSSTLFTHLDKLEIGDTFVIKVLDQEFTYQVDNIEIVKPSDLDLLKIDKNKDYVTLMTCTPYGINTHRILVRGVRVDNAPKEVFITTEAFKVDKFTVALIILTGIALVLLIIMVVKPIPESKKKIKEQYIYPSKYKSRRYNNDK